MSCTIRALFRLMLATGLAAALPLCAQLNPQLAVTPTDFLDLYQASASSSTQNRPEIATIFDFSGSMRSVMFHPLYQNGDIYDGDDYLPIRFVLSTPSSHTFTITATSAMDPNCATTITVTVGGGFGASSSASDTVVGYMPGHSTSRYRYQYTVTLAAITYNPTTTPVTSGSVITFSTTATESNTSVGSSATLPTWNPAINWTCSGGTITPSGQWTAPSTDPFVTASIPSGSTWDNHSSPALSSTTLVAPDGAVVTSSMVSATSTTFDGGSAGVNDVRNWVRCASHIRFTYTDSGNTRTVDFPIPWQVMSSASSGAPLSALKVHDGVSGNDMDIDSTYTLANGDCIFSTSGATPYSNNDQSSYTESVGSSTITSVYLALVSYRASYINWLLTGKYPATNNHYGGMYIVYDAANPNLAGGQLDVSWGQGFGASAGGHAVYAPTYTSYANSTASTGVPTYLGDVQVDASTNIVPSRTRSQAVKEAAIRTWIAYQSQVIWAFRFLDPGHESGAGVSINNNSTTYAGSADPTTTPTYGNYSAWQVMNGNSVNGMRRIASYIPYNGTPLTAAMARTMAQYSDPSSVFNAIENGTTAPVPQVCQNHFLILFTDGLDNNGNSGANTNSTTPYIFTPSGSTNPTFDAATGNRGLIGTPSNLNGGSWWNLFTMAGAGAHLGDTSLGTGNYLTAPSAYTTSTTSVSTFLPFAIPRRNTTIFSPARRIQTYTVGVSLGGYINTAGGPKQSLFYAAVMGDPAQNHYANVNALSPFALKNPQDPTSGIAPNCVYYFDGTNPTALVNALNYAFFAIINTINPDSTTNPNLPFTGGSLGQEIYLGQFTPPTQPSPLWPGDVLMYSTRIINNVPVIVDKNGTPTTTLNASTAMWSAAYSLNATPWSSRHLYTRIPGSSTTPEPGLTTFSDVTPGAFDTISPYLLNGYGEPLIGSAPASTAAKQAAVQWAAGGDINGTLTNGRPVNNRSAIMGDVINSTPAALTYLWSDVSAQIANYPHLAAVSGGNTFRLIIVGDNQGWIHGFGEVSSVTTVTDSSGNPVTDANGNAVTVAQGNVDELWAFMPTDLLPYLDYFETSNNLHRFTCDGAPTIYFLDLPTTNSPNGDGIFEVSNNERAIAVIGMRKGGRSYYALNISNPFQPTLQWSLRPDESALLASKTWVDPKTGTSYAAIAPGLNATNVTNIVANMGLSTSVPALGRVQYNGYLRDAIFLGGGYSVSQLDHNFPTYPNPPAAQSTSLGRSVLALDVWSGQILAAVDLTKVSSTAGPVPAGLVPFEFILGSGMAQRAYFMDLNGGLWSWDANTVSNNAPYTNYRIDSSDLYTWAGDGSTTPSTTKIRKIFQDSSGNSSIYSGLPAPWVVGNFPGLPYTAGNATPAAVGITMASGDRNNPIDETAGYPLGTNPALRFRLNVVFDRQDAPAWSGVLTSSGTNYVITDSNLMNFTGTNALPSLSYGNALITPGSTTYYLAPTNSGGTANTGSTKFGYYIDFPPGTANSNAPPPTLYPKALTEPSVVSGSLFYSYFVPTTAGVCGGGTGNTYSDIICDVMNPSLSVTNAACTTGNALPFTSWVGVPSNFSNFGTRGVFQGGTTAIVNPVQGGPTQQVQFATMLNSSSNAFPKARVWRTVH